MLEGTNRFFVAILGALLLAVIFLIRNPSHTTRPPITLHRAPEGETSTNEFLKNGSVGVSEIQKGNGGENLLEPFKPITGVVDGLVPLGTPPIAEPPRGQSISDEELFAILYPHDQIRKLYGMRDDFVRIGWMAPKEPSVIKNEDDLYRFLDNLLAVALEKDFYTPDQVEANRHSVQNYREYLQKKKAAIRRQQASIYRSLDELEIGGDGAFGDLGFFASMVPFWPSEAQAQSLDIWQTSPLCFKNFNSQQGLKGVEPKGFCCNCGCKIVGYVCVYVPDCTIAYDEVCDVQFGCLNYTCEGYTSNAVWDGNDGYPTYGNTNPTTSKCGCDEPEKVFQNQQGDE